MGEPSSAVDSAEALSSTNPTTSVDSAVDERDFAANTLPSQAPKLPSLRSASDTAAPSASIMTSSSTPLGGIAAARRPSPAQPTNSSLRGGALPSDMQAKMKAFHLSRRGTPPSQPVQGLNPSLPVGQIPNGGITVPNAPGAMGGLQLPPGPRPTPFGNIKSSPAVPNLRMNAKAGLAAKRGFNTGMKLSDAMGSPSSPTIDGLPSNPTAQNLEKPKEPETMFNKYAEIVDTSTGSLRFKGKATLHGSGIDFSSGSSFSISLDEVDTIDELGKGNYGVVYQVRHSRPKIRRPGLGLAGNKLGTSLPVVPSLEAMSPDGTQPLSQRNTTGKIMAMKEIRLELDDAKFAAIIMELDVLHRCVSPFIVDFYGAFFQEGAVYICMEFMDGGSIDKLYGDGIPENVLRKIALSTVMGLKSLKDDHNIIHRDVKPTNILVNTRGQVKICDFGVSGNLVASIAKTNIGCQSYMAPERIASGGVAQAGANPGGGTYSVQSDIWSLGLTIIECALGQYPYPPETYNNIFSQLSAIVDGDPPDLPTKGYSDQARDFVRSCLNKVPKNRPTYAMLIRHPWLAPLFQPPTISEDAEAEAEAEASASIDTVSPSNSTHSAASEELDAESVMTADKEVADWVASALEKRRLGKMQGVKKPALHAAPLNAVPASPKATG